MNTTIQTLFVPAGTEELYRVEDNWKEFTVKPKPTSKPGDINGDGQVDSQDLFELIKDYRKTGEAISSPAADINGDGQVDSQDLFELIQNYRK